MEAEARYTYVGLGVLALLAALITAVLWLRQVGGRNDFNRYAIHFEQQALDGLEVGAEVTLRGIRVGRVEDYALTGDTLNKVRVQVRIDRRAPIRTNTAAVITRNFVTGIAAITLVNREPAGATLTEVPEGETLPVIAEGRSDLDEIAGRVHQVGDLAATALSNINQLFTPDSRETLLSAMRSVRDLSQGLDARLTALDKQVGQTLTRVGQAADAVGGAARAMGGAARQLADAGQHAAGVAERGEARIDRTLGEAEQTLAEARRAIERVALATQELQRQAAGTAQRLESTAASVDDQMQAALGELRLSVESANRVLDGLRDPRAALLGPGPRQLGPGEKLP